MQEKLTDNQQELTERISHVVDKLFQLRRLPTWRVRERSPERHRKPEALEDG